MAHRLLIVEDEPAFAEVLSELLSDEGYAVVHVRDGVTALAMLSSQRPRVDLVLCDVMLPGLRGDRLAREVRERFPQRRLPILLMSASADPHVTLRDVAFIPKPFEASELLAQLRSMLAPAAYTP
jgi:CheY-like chemotaxis protein